MSDRICEMLLSAGNIDSRQLAKAMDLQKTQGLKSYEAVVKLGYTSEDDLVEFLAHRVGVAPLSLDEIEVDAEVAKIISGQTAQMNMLVPYRKVGSTLHVVMANPTDLEAIRDIEFRTGLQVQLAVATGSSIRKVLDQVYNMGIETNEIPDEFEDEDMEASAAETSDFDVTDLSKMAQEAPVIKLVNYVLRQAIQRRASDIHIEAYEKVMRVRLRIDGSLYEFMKPQIKQKNAIVSRIKIMSRLDIAERRMPQDGRIKLNIGRGRDIDLRVSITPMLHGEKVVMRLLDKGSLQLDMTKLGLEEEPLKEFKDAIHRPFGMVLVTGPTGSGKTTTLYSALSELNASDVNISTVEDPIEYNIYGINQMQVHEEIGLTFAAALRSFLRQDPDIIMVGEIRDYETAEIAVKAALTGHLVLSTIHTNDAPQTINRLLNMGVESFLVANSVNLILAQRLSRLLCEDCKKEIQVPVEALRELGLKTEEIGSFPVYEAKGCPACNNTGYKGRIALYEVMPMTDNIKELVLVGASALQIKREAIRLGMNSLRMAGVSKLKQGITTIQEIVRATMAD